MANPFLGVRIPRELDEAIAARMQRTGQSESDVVIKALKAYLGLLPCQDRLTAIEQRLANLEAILRLYETSQPLLGASHGIHGANHSLEDPAVQTPSPPLEH